MAFKLSAKTKSILNQIQKNPILAIDIEGVDNLLTSDFILKRITWDDGTHWDQGARWDGFNRDETAIDVINLRESTRVITQEIYPDKEGSSSIASIMVTMVDKKGFISKLLARNAIGEILGKKVTVSLGFKAGAYPEDYMPVMNAIVTDFSNPPSAINLTLSHSETLKRQSILPEFSTELVGSITTETTFNVASTEDFKPSQDALTTYIKIDDEIMELLSIDSTTQITVLRGELGTLEQSHDNEAEITSVYVLQGFPLDLAQKIMLSDANNEFFDSDIKIKSFEYVSPLETIVNAVIFNDQDIERNTGLVPGDIIQIDTYGNYTVESFGKLDDGSSYIIVEEGLPYAASITENWRFKSQWNVLNFGLGMLPFEVDSVSFDEIRTEFSANFVEYEFRLEEGITEAREFINKELFFTSGCYGVPRNARSSVRFLAPPLTTEEIPTLNETNVTNMIDLKPRRSTNNYFYNDILYAFSKSVLDGEFKSFSNFIDQDSVNLFKVGTKQLRIESGGLRRGSQTDLILGRLSARYLDRYKGAATFIDNVKVSFKTGFNIQVGDVVIFGGENTKITDIDTGEYGISIAKYEVINQSISMDGLVTLSLLSTNFSIQGTFGVFSPSSYVASGSTTTKLVLSPISNSEQFDTEQPKWVDFVGTKIRVRSEDFTFDETVTLENFDTQDNNALIISELPSMPSVGFIVEPALYNEYEVYGANEIDDLIKIKYTFTMPQSVIDTVTSDTVFDVVDASNLFDGQRIAVHSNDFTRDAFEVTIDSVVGNTVTLTEALDFTPIAGDLVETRQKPDLDGYLLR